MHRTSPSSLGTSCFPRSQSHPRLALCPRKPGNEAGPALPLRTHDSGEQEQGRARKPAHPWHLCLPCLSASPPAHVPRSDCLLSSLQALTSQSLYRQAGPARVTACLSLPAPVSSLELQVSNFSPFPLPPPLSPRPECPARSSSVWGLCSGRGGLFGGEKPASGCDADEDNSARSYRCSPRLPVHVNSKAGD